MASRAGSKNRNKQFLIKRLQDIYGDDFHPILRAAENADELQKAAVVENSVAGYKAALDGWEKIAVYTESKPKPTMPLVEFSMPDKATPLQKAEAILKAVSKGQMPPDIGAMLIQAAKHVIDIEETTELKERLDAIEKELGIGQ